MYGFQRINVSFHFISFKGLLASRNRPEYPMEWKIPVPNTPYISNSVHCHGIRTACAVKYCKVIVCRKKYYFSSTNCSTPKVLSAIFLVYLALPTLTPKPILGTYCRNQSRSGVLGKAASSWIQQHSGFFMRVSLCLLFSWKWH